MPGPSVESRRNHSAPLAGPDAAFLWGRGGSVARPECLSQPRAWLPAMRLGRSPQEPKVVGYVASQAW